MNLAHDVKSFFHICCGNTQKANTPFLVIKTKGFLINVKALWPQFYGQNSAYVHKQKS